MSQLTNRTAVAALLVLAPTLEVVEQLLSPLTGASTRDDLEAVAGHQSVFALSVLVGMAATVLYIPAFVGLAARCVGRSPVAARVGAAIAVLSMAGFMGIRAIQAIELQTVRSGLPIGASADLIDGVSTNPIGATLLVMFLGGSVIGMVALGVACWRAGLPRPAVLLMACFPLVDLALPGHVGAVASHVVLLAGLAWIATSLTRGASRRAPNAVPSTAY